MAIKVRCAKCDKKISIDDAFAGGVCRCPYCKAISNVPGGRAQPTVAAFRPDAPPTEVHGPAEVVPKATLATATPDGAAIPVADRVLFQGIAAIVMMVALIGMVIGGVVLALSIRGGASDGVPNGDDAGRQPNPFVVAGEPTVAGDVRIQTPVVYVLDAGASMRMVYGYAVSMMAASARSLEAGSRFGVVLCQEPEPEDPFGDEDFDVDEPQPDADEATAVTVMPGGYAAVPSDIASAVAFADAAVPGGASDLRAGLAAALELEPATIVVLANESTADAYASAREIRSQGRRLVTVALAADETAAAALRRLAELGGGQSRAFAGPDLQGWHEEAPLP